MEYTLEPYTRPSCYIGEHYFGYLCVPVGKHRDSDALARSNYRVALSRLRPIADVYLNEQSEDEYDNDPLETPEQGHWAVGSIYPVFVRADCPALVAEAQRICDELNSYPCLDEEDWSNEESEEAQEVWQGCYNLREKIAFCVEAGLSMFAARSKHYPYDLQERLLRN
jgi:hypothetical protein